MDIFIRRLPNSTTRLDLMQFIASALKPKWYRLQFSPLGKLTHCDICRIDDSQNDQVEYHGIARIDPPSAALQVINRLNGELFKNKQVEVRKFFRRSAKRDRRHLRKEGPLPGRLEKRKQDRRRPDLHMEHLHAGTTTDSSLHHLKATRPIPH